MANNTMSKIVDAEDIVEKVVRVNGKASAQVVITIPAALSGDFPMGKVHMKIESVQGELFNRPVRGKENNRHPVGGRKVAGTHA